MSIHGDVVKIFLFFYIIVLHKHLISFTVRAICYVDSALVGTI